MGRRFTARYPGKYSGCCRRIYPGETVTYNGGVLVHDACIADLPCRPTYICWDCWQERGIDGSCGCRD